MRKKPLKFLWMTLIALAMTGCYPAGPDYVEDLDVVYTDHDSNFDFKAKSTYSMPDKIVVDIDKNGDTVCMKKAFADPILQRIDANMADNGWTKVDISTKPDVVLTPAGIKSTTVFYSYWYDWWYGGYYPGWGWGYPPYYSVSSITTGTLVIVMSDPNTENSIDKNERAWFATMGGILTGSYNQNRIDFAINQSFKQSPYLNTK